MKYKEGSIVGGTVTGGAKARETNIRKYGEDYYRNIGSMGGKASGTGGWYKNLSLIHI